MAEFDLSEFLPYQLAVASSRVSRAFAEHRREFGLSVPEWRVLAHLAQAGTVSVREIHARVDMDKSKVSRAASRLEAAGLVSKRSHPEDRRLVELTLTDAGHQLFATIVPAAKAFNSAIVAALGPDASALSRGLRTLTDQPSA